MDAPGLGHEAAGSARVASWAEEAVSNKLACPVCGADTMVAETRVNPAGLRRRRHCTKDECGGRLTTVEIPMGERALRTDEPLVLVPLSVLDGLIDRLDEWRSRSIP